VTALSHTDKVKLPAILVRIKIHVSRDYLGLGMLVAITKEVRLRLPEKLEKHVV